MYIANGSYVNPFFFVLVLGRHSSLSHTLVTIKRSLSLDEQLHWCWQYETLFVVSSLYMDVFGLFSVTLGVELLFL
jgi:hypothetical protein